MAWYQLQTLAHAISLNFWTLFIVGCDPCVIPCKLMRRMSMCCTSDHQDDVTDGMAAFQSSSTCCWKAFTNRRAASPRLPAGLETHATFLSKSPYTWVHLEEVAYNMLHTVHYHHGTPVRTSTWTSWTIVNDIKLRIRKNWNTGIVNMGGTKADSKPCKLSHEQLAKSAAVQQTALSLQYGSLYIVFVCACTLATNLFHQWILPT